MLSPKGTVCQLKYKHFSLIYNIKDGTVPNEGDQSPGEGVLGLVWWYSQVPVVGDVGREKNNSKKIANSAV